MFNPRTQRGHLQPGQWDYFEMVLDPLDTSWMVRLSPASPYAAGLVLPSLLSDSVLDRGILRVEPSFAARSRIVRGTPFQWVTSLPEERIACKSAHQSTLHFMLPVAAGIHAAARPLRAARVQEEQARSVPANAAAGE